MPAAPSLFCIHIESIKQVRGFQLCALTCVLLLLAEQVCGGIESAVQESVAAVPGRASATA
jgi:hypothetical protein